MPRVHRFEMLTRMRGCIIIECSKKEYDAADLVVAADQQSQSVEGEIEIVQYNCPSSMSMLMIARNAENALKAQGFSHGTDAGRLLAKGLGDSKPVADNTTEDGRAKNRRVALVKM